MICLVTDRRRLAGRDASLAEARRCLVEQARYAAAAGVDLIQVRERDLDTADVDRLVAELIDAVRGTATRVVVNDRIDIALARGAAGVHLRGDSIDVADARRLAPAGFLIGRSVHSVDDAVRTSAAEYLIAGTVFRSASKPAEGAQLGIAGLRDIVRATRTPVLAIGGVTEERMDEIAAAGASGVAAIGLFLASDGGGSAGACRAMPLQGLVERLRARFDRVDTAP